MTDLVVIVPSRGRPHIVAELAEVFRKTCTAPVDGHALGTRLVLALDKDDPTYGEYVSALVECSRPIVDSHGRVVDDSITQVPGWHQSMVHALNSAAVRVSTAASAPEAIAFMGDDHRPRTMGWDAAYLDALRTTPGLVYGNDLIQGIKLPTQVAISASVVRALGHMAPPVLKHMYVDNYWLALGHATGCITYLPDVVVEHLHPYAGTAPVDEGYLRVNSREVFDHDEAAFAAYWAKYGERDVAAVRSATAAVSCG